MPIASQPVGRSCGRTQAFLLNCQDFLQATSVMPSLPLPPPPPPSDPGDQVTSCPIAVDPTIGQLGFGFGRGWGCLTFWLTRVIGSTSTCLDERFHDSPIHVHQPRRKRHGCGEPLRQLQYGEFDKCCSAQCRTFTTGKHDLQLASPRHVRILWFSFR